MTQTALVRRINSHIQREFSVYLRSHITGLAIRLRRARSRKGAMEVQSLNTGTWTPTAASDHIEIMDRRGVGIANYEVGILAQVRGKTK